jgi:hypothetical protein
MPMPFVHLRSLDGLEDEIRSVFCAMGALCCGSKPIILLGGHQHKFPPPMLGDFDWLSERTMLYFTELALKFQ